MDALSAPLAPTEADSPLADPASLPLRPPSAAEEFGPTLVVAPHPDDESLGCGGVLALLARAGVPAHVLFVSDGTGSHRDSPTWPAERLRALREAEALAALAQLGLAARDATFLRLPDQAVPQRGHPGFAAAVEVALVALRACRPATILIPWRGEYHCDHVAAWQIVRAAADRLAPRPRLLEYPIWLWDATMPHRAPSARDTTAWRLDIAPALPQKLAAIRQHRSQLTDLIADAPQPFRLDPAFLANFARPWEVYLEERLPTTSRGAMPTPDPAAASTAPAYFDRMYAADDDPWRFETSEYERAKYDATLAALPRARYRRALELGCSIGILTARLAPRCDALVAVDVAERALALARERCRAWPQVGFRRLHLPTEYPAGRFDLVLMSEVGYYWSEGDLALGRERIIASLGAGGHLLLVHWTEPSPDYPLTGDRVHQEFLDRSGDLLRHLGGERAATYRIDLFERR